MSNQWLTDDIERMYVRSCLKASMAPLGVVPCVLFGVDSSEPGMDGEVWSIEFSRRLLWSLCVHSEARADMLTALRGVLWELGAFITEITDSSTVVDDETPDEHDRLRCGCTAEQHAEQFSYQARRTFVECCVASDLDGAIRVVDAVVADAKDHSQAFNDVLRMGAQVLSSIAMTVHVHG